MTRSKFVCSLNPLKPVPSSCRFLGLRGVCLLGILLFVPGRGASGGLFQAPAGVSTEAAQQAAKLVLRGFELLGQGEQVEAESAFMTALRLNPREGEARLGLGRIRMIQHRLIQAQEEFRRAIETLPYSAPAHAALAEILIELGQPAQARALLVKAIVLDPQDFHSRFRLAKVLMDAGESSRGMDQLEIVVRQRPEFWPAREQLGMSLLRRGNRDGAAA